MSENYCMHGCNHRAESCATCAACRHFVAGQAVTEKTKMLADVEPHLRTEDEIRELQPRVDFMAERMCQTQGMVLWALKEAGLTVVLLDPHAREISPDGAAIAAAEERGRRAGIEERDELLRECEALIASCGGMADTLGYAGTAQKCRDMLAKLSALAPRDSAPATSDYPGCGDPAHDCRDGVCGAGPAPRDSGKDLTAADPADRFAKDRK